MNKGLKWALISLPILIGGFIVYKTLRPKKPKQDTPPPIPGGDGVTTTGGGYTPPPPPPKADFPMGLGSKGAKVKELQQAIISTGDATAIGFLGRAGADGQFGTGTEKAVKKLLGKIKVDSQADIDKIKNTRSVREGNTNRVTIAKKLVDLFKNKRYADFYAIQDIQIATGKRTSDGRDYDRTPSVLKKGTRLDIPKSANLVVDVEGFIRATTSNKFWEFSPYGMEVK